jgi:predicted ATPase
MKLTSAKIKNFKSLGDVELSFRDLTIIVGSNSSGKSNSLEALNLVKAVLLSESLPKPETMQRFLRSGSDNICSTITVEDNDKQAEYTISLKLNKNNTIIANEKLKVNGTNVIEIVNGVGNVRDEDGGNNQKYQSAPESVEGLALRAAGNFGNKPFTKKLASYIREWKFYDIDPDIMRADDLMEIVMGLSQSSKRIARNESIPSLDSRDRKVQEILNYWAENERDKFDKISKELQDCLNISLVGDKGQIVRVKEGDGKELSLSSMSDGTLRLIAYFTLLYQSEIPTIIGIEEPERNLHPRILKDLASIMKRLSRKTQVVFTTHSSQLLDCFEPEEISSEISVLLLTKQDDSGTKSFLLDQLAEKRDDLLDWMNDFGLGSAVYHSNLLQEILGS